MNTISLSDDRREALMGHLQTLFQKEFGASLSDFQAEQVVQLFTEKLGPIVYNQAVQDVRAHFQTRLDDLEGEVYVNGSL